MQLICNSFSGRNLIYSAGHRYARAVWGVGLRPFACWDYGFESRGCMEVLFSSECCELSGRGLCIGL